MKEAVTSDYGGYWTEAKLTILAKYLRAFNFASKRAGETVYLDLFAGSLWNRRPDTQSIFRGSTSVALETIPEFSKLIFWELPAAAAQLQRDLAANYPNYGRWEVVPGDCNVHLEDGLSRVKDLRYAPTFAFIDPKGLDVAWTTLHRLSLWRVGKTKTELWILFPEPALERVLGLKGSFGRRSADRLDRLYGDDSWVPIHQRRVGGELDPEATRAEYVNLLRWLLQNSLHYKHTRALGLYNRNGNPVYTMVFATDHSAGLSIMNDVYAYASVHELPALRSRALAAKRRERDERLGTPSLFEVTPKVEPREYRNIEPWQPPAPISDELLLDYGDEDW